MTPFWPHIRECARAHIQQALDEHRTVTQAAATLQLNRTHMYQLMRRLGIRPCIAGGNDEWRSLGF